MMETEPILKSEYLRYMSLSAFMTGYFGALANSRIEIPIHIRIQILEFLIMAYTSRIGDELTDSHKGWIKEWEQKVKDLKAQENATTDDYL